MKKTIHIVTLIIVSILITGCDLVGSSNELPLEMVAYNSLTREEQKQIPVSPKDSSVQVLSVDETIKSYLPNDYKDDKVHAVIFRGTETDNEGNLTVFLGQDRKSVIGKGNY
ncbi:hypothetical protein [Mangrovibacillus cuniculi]|uniref:Lipoprotein n=1 Tax=Mangrovibacillus cuniculi TaxID=2593652 RepID=A0A7S8C9H2_9BACI|nr:hypothetical protein [Mangrovibacillus cuniculi]QPC45886.1 hypothetical protein G8O30_02390 [Mangrovibacillus cuniculi]